MQPASARIEAFESQLETGKALERDVDTRYDTVDLDGLGLTLGESLRFGILQGSPERLSVVLSVDRSELVAAFDPPWRPPVRLGRGLRSDYEMGTVPVGHRELVSGPCLPLVKGFQQILTLNSFPLGENHVLRRSLGCERDFGVA